MDTCGSYKKCPLYRVFEFWGKKRKQKLRWRVFFYTIRTNSINKIILKSKETSNITLFLIFERHLLLIFNFKWSLPLTSMKFSLNQASLMLLLLLSFYYKLHLLLFLAPNFVSLQSSHSCRGDWKESQSCCWIRTRNTCKLFFMEMLDLKCAWVTNSLKKLDNELHVKVKWCIK